jgi:hypothetical protein
MSKLDFHGQDSDTDIAGFTKVRVRELKGMSHGYKTGMYFFSSHSGREGKAPRAGAPTQ